MEERRLSGGTRTGHHHNRTNTSSSSSIRRNGEKRHYWTVQDIFGSYNRRKIQAKFPVPGVAVRDFNEREAGNAKRKEEHDEMLSSRRRTHVEAIRHHLNASLRALTRDTSARSIDRLVRANRKVNEMLTLSYNYDANTRPRDRFRKENSDRQFKMLSVSYPHVDPSKFRGGVLPASSREQLHFLHSAQTQRARESDVLTNDQVIAAVQAESGGTQMMPTKRLVRDYGSAYRKVNMAMQREKMRQRTIAKKISRDHMNRQRLAHQNRKLLEKYKQKRGSISVVLLDGKPVCHREAALRRAGAARDHE